MEWVIEPLTGFAASVEHSKGSTCSGGGTQNWCDCILGLKTCNCSQGLVLGEKVAEVENP
jgi:hypothetical protein